MMKDNDMLNVKLISVEEELYTSKVTQLDLIKQLEILKQRLILDQDKIREIRNHSATEQWSRQDQFYIGKFDDQTDCALEKYLSMNVDRSKLPISFIR